MTAIERKFFVVCGASSLLDDSQSESEDFQRMDLYANTLIPIATNHYSALANRPITADEWIDITVDPDSDEYPDSELSNIGPDWDMVKSVLVLMASELYSKVGVTGMDSISEGGLSQAFASNYSKGLITVINTQKKLRTL